ncbi:MAG: lamin tail domain-containing protein [Tidjanibacter sp.]|nr:lamin tail domain-containing protein [Tidjanibacter sp.]
MKKLFVFAAMAAMALVSCDNGQQGEGPVGGGEADYTKLVFNELCGAGEDSEKFIELYNNGDVELCLEGVMIEKDGGDLSWEGKAGDVIAAKSVYLILGAKGTTANGLSTGFSPKKTVLMQLSAPDGTLIDTFQRGDEDPAAAEPWGAKLDENPGSWSRVPDGTGKFLQTDATPGAVNATEGTEDATVRQ